MPRQKNHWRYKVLSSQFEYVYLLCTSLGLLKRLKNGKLSLNTGNYKAFCYFLQRSARHYRILLEDSEGWLSVRKVELNDWFNDWRPEALRAKGLLEVNFHYKPGQKSASYRVPAAVLLGFAQAGTLNPQGSSYVNLYTGQPWTPEDDQAIRAENAKAWEPFPPLMRQAAEQIQQCPFDYPAVIVHLKAQREAFSKLGPEHPHYERQLGRVINDELCFAAIRERIIRGPDKAGLCHYWPEYKPLITGRIGAIGGQFQSCSREMKLAAFRSLPLVHNYDLTASQVRICQAEFQKQGISCPWLDQYLSSDRQERMKYAERIGTSYDAWKRCLMALIMAAEMPKKLDHKGAILEILREEAPDEVEQALNRLRREIASLLPSLRLWHRKITRQAREKGEIVNTLGIVRGYNGLRRKEAGCAAHILQGAEALFIHTLALLGSKFEYLPTDNQHDGLITSGKISAMAIQEAKRLTRLHYFELEEKKGFGIS